MPRLRTNVLIAILAPGISALSISCAFPTDPEEADEIGATTAAIDDDDDPPTNACLDGARGTLTASATTIDLWQSTTLTWNTRVPAGCTNVRFYINADSVSKSGSRTNVPIANTTYRLRASVVGSYERELSRVDINVILPPVVHITSNDWEPLFVQAVGTPDRQVVVANNVELDLSHRQFIPIESNVMIQGGRKGLQPGPRIFTRTHPSVLFMIGQGVQNVRITGLRIQGADWGPGEKHNCRGFLIDSATNITIANNEIFGWRLAGIQVRDPLGVMPSPPPEETASIPQHAVNILDNYIHHNQSISGFGYGVEAGPGSHPLIMRNVFDWNRHAISADGDPGTGYTAYHNLVLENGGLHYWVPFPGFWKHTHQFDMHGMNHCGIADIWSDSQYNCGPAGHTILIRHNAFFYTSDHTIKLRGTPEVGMFVGQNVFKNGVLWAAAQTETGLVFEPGNEFGYDGMDHLGTCDFDGDGLNDTFLATGQNWWMRSGTTGPWEFLNASTKKREEVELGFFTNDNKCDVFDGETTFPGGRPIPIWRQVPNVPVVPIFSF